VDEADDDMVITSGKDAEKPAKRGRVEEEVRSIEFLRVFVCKLTNVNVEAVSF